MEAGLRIGWGKLRAGKEKEAMTLFQDAVTYYGKKMADGKISFFEPFFTTTGELTSDGGFFIVKGPITEIFAILEDEAYKEITARAFYLIDTFKVDLLAVGEEIGRQMERFEKVVATT